MLGTPQTSAPQNQKGNSRVVPAKSVKKPTFEPQGKSSSSSRYLCRSRRGWRRKAALLAAAITTLQKNPRFKNLFNQLKLTANKWRIATKALVSIALGARVECLVVEIRADKAFLQDTNEITFSDEDMDIEYSDHRRPLYLVASINQIPIQVLQ